MTEIKQKLVSYLQNNSIYRYVNEKLGEKEVEDEAHRILNLLFASDEDLLLTDEEMRKYLFPTPDKPTLSCIHNLLQAQLSKVMPKIKALEAQIAENDKDLKEYLKIMDKLQNGWAKQVNEDIGIREKAIVEAKKQERERIKANICREGYLTTTENGHGFLVTDELWVKLFQQQSLSEEK